MAKLLVNSAVASALVALGVLIGVLYATREADLEAAHYTSLERQAVLGSAAAAEKAYVLCAEEMARAHPADDFLGECGALRMLWIENEIKDGDRSRLEAMFRTLDLAPTDSWLARRPAYLAQATASVLAKCGGVEGPECPGLRTAERSPSRR